MKYKPQKIEFNTPTELTNADDKNNIQKGNENYYNKVIDKLKENGETEFRLEFAKSIKYKNNKYSIKDFISIKGDGERVWYSQIFDVLALLNVNDNKIKEIVFIS
ncbi:hypothetical protein ACTFIR_009380 [Dictyostelium discoideum]